MHFHRVLLLASCTTLHSGEPYKEQATLNVNNGEVYYPRLGGGMMCHPDVRGLSTSVSSNLSQVSKDAGVSEMKECMYIANHAPELR